MCPPPAFWTLSVGWVLAAIAVGSSAVAVATATPPSTSRPPCSSFTHSLGGTRHRHTISVDPTAVAALLPLAMKPDQVPAPTKQRRKFAQRSSHGGTYTQSQEERQLLVAPSIAVTAAHIKAICRYKGGGTGGKTAGPSQARLEHQGFVVCTHTRAHTRARAGVHEALYSLLHRNTLHCTHLLSTALGLPPLLLLLLGL